MNHFISLETAIALTSRYQNRREAILLESERNKNLLSLSETFDRSAFDTVLSRPECTSLRIYYGMTSNDQVHAIIVGVDANGADILPQQTLATSEDEDYIIETGTRCPDICPEDSPLNNP